MNLALGFLRVLVVTSAAYWCGAAVLSYDAYNKAVSQVRLAPGEYCRRTISAAAGPEEVEFHRRAEAEGPVTRSGVGTMSYNIQMPDGHTYYIEGPLGASDEQVRAEVLRQVPDAGKVPVPRVNIGAADGSVVHTLKEFRQKYPQYNDLSDRELADRLRDKFYPRMSVTEFYAEVGLRGAHPQPSAKPEHSRLLTMGWGDTDGKLRRCMQDRNLGWRSGLMAAGGALALALAIYAADAVTIAALWWIAAGFKSPPPRQPTP